MATRFGSRVGAAPALHRRTPSTNATVAAVMAPATRVRRRENHGRTDGAADDVSALANCAALTNRSAGAFASALETAASMAGGIVSRSRRPEGTGSVSRFAITPCALGPV